MAKFEKQLINKETNKFGMTLLPAHAQYICIVNAKYQKPSVKALVQVDFPVHKQNPYLKANRKKWLISQSCYFVKMIVFFASKIFMQMFSESILCRQSNELFPHKLVSAQAVV